jgi:hypothetical protein
MNTIFHSVFSFFRVTYGLNLKYLKILIKRTKSNSYSKYFDNCVKFEHLGLYTIGTHHKNFGEKRKNEYTLSSVKGRHSTKTCFTKCLLEDTRQRS